MARARNLTIREFAELSAELARPFADRKTILDRIGLDESSWASTKEGMALFMTARMKAGDLGAIEAYRAAFAGETPPPLEVATPSPSSPPMAREEVVHEGKALIPSYLLPENEPPRPPIQPALYQPPSGPAHHVGRAPEGAPLPQGQVETDEMDMSAFRGGSATPFARGPLPFGEAKAPAPPVRPAIQKPPAALVETTYLPEGSAPAEPKPFEEKAGRHPPTMHLPGPLPQQSGFTRTPLAAGRKSLPFQRGGPISDIPIPPGWTIARYAALCIDLNVSGLAEPDVLQAAGITREERRALDAHWEQRMLTDPALRLEWKTHADRREAELSKGRR